MIYYLRELQRDNRLIEKKRKSLSHVTTWLFHFSTFAIMSRNVGLGLASLSILQRNCEYFNLHISSFLWRPVS